MFMHIIKKNYMKMNVKSNNFVNLVSFLIDEGIDPLN